MKTILKGFLALILALLMVSLAYVHFNRKGLSQKVFKALQKEIATELTVSEARLDLFSAFPRVAFQMDSVYLQGLGDTELLRADNLRVTLSLFSAFSDDIRFRKLSLKDAVINVNRLKDSALSFNIIDSSGGSGNPGPSLSFHKVELENVAITFHDPYAKQKCNVFFSEATITGGYRNEVIELMLNASVSDAMLLLDKDTYLNKAEGRIEGNLAIDLANEKYTFEDIAFDLNGVSGNLQGSVEEMEKGQLLDFQLGEIAGSMTSLIDMLPGSTRKEIPVSEVQGKFVCDGRIHGMMQGKTQPEVDLEFTVKDAGFQSKTGLGKLEDISLDGHLDLSGNANSSIALREVKGTAHGQKFRATLIISDIDDPVLECTFDGALPAGFLMDYAGAGELIQEASGALHFHDVAIGPVRLSSWDFTDMRDLSGRCTLANLTMQTQKALYKIPDGEISLRSDSLILSSVDARVEGDRIAVEGWFAGISDALEAEDFALLDYHLDIQSDEFHVTHWIPGLSAEAEKKREPSVKPVALRSASVLRIPKGSVAFTTGTFYYDQLEFEDVTASIRSDMNGLEYELDGKSTGGDLSADGVLTIGSGYRLTLHARGDGMDMRSCFESCGNFGQQVLRAEHLKGKSDIRMICEISWDANGKLRSDEMHVMAGISIRDGELQDFKMLEQFSDYAHAEDLKQIRFARLDNVIEVKDGNVYIPAMFIRSNAANLVVNGIHRLDNHILYNIKVNAGQVLSNKMKKHNPSLNVLPARREGTFNLHFTVTGTVDDFTYSLNKRSAESSFTQSEAMRDRIHAELEKVFGESLDLAEPAEWESVPEYDLEVQGEDVYLDEID